MKLSEKIWDILNNDRQRVYACEKSIFLFSLYYFTRYHHHSAPDFHKEMYKDLQYEDLTGVVWEMFRESAKTTLAKISIIHKIVYNKKKFITWTSFDEKKAESNLFDVALELQTNQRLIKDFGQLFYEKTIEKSSKKKSVGDFLTTNGVRVKAYSVGQSPRGEVSGDARPDYVILDDIETSKTVVSVAMTKKVIEYVDELISGMSVGANVLVLCNKLSNNGSIAYIKEKVQGNGRWRIRSKAVKENGVIQWSQKYVETIEQATDTNKTIEDKEKHKTSLEQKKLDLGLTVYNREMLNQPISDGEREFKLEWLQERYNPETLKGKTINRYVTIDVADSKEREEKRSKGQPDWTGTTVVDWDTENNWNITYVKRLQLNAPELIDWIFYVWETYRPIKIGVEKKAFEDQVTPYINMKSDETGIFPVVEELKHGGTRKEDRIRGALQGRAQAKKLRFKAGATDDSNELVQELYDFPVSKFDDLSDALAYVEQIGVRPLVKGDSTVHTELHKEFMAHKASSRGMGDILSSIID